MTIQIRYNMRQRDITDIQGEQEPLFEYERNLFPFFLITTYASKNSARGIPLFRI